MDATTLVSKALEYYDMNKEKYEKYFNDVQYIQFESRPDQPMKRDYLLMLDADMNVLYNVHYEVIGIYFNYVKSWQWAWSHAPFPKKTTTVSRNILKYAFDLESDESLYLKTELVTSRFKVDNMTQLDIHAAIGSYLSKNPIVFPYVNYPYEFYQVTDEEGKIKVVEAEIMATDKNITGHARKISKIFRPDEKGEDYMVYYLILDPSDVDVGYTSQELLKESRESRDRKN